ncbi:MAG: hypothetical protein A3G76_08955 [Acidobacteria bacterium RIFCSPLOWO2_12_FULL_65_11]|nr:MAG: hypothetical protein A3H95_01305 [Acidobacteria bacterium RIFCSPLOWO2_02_FULL_64_15]OFW32144.1 MAG: hypothetical protein A3G76_08955 [Acidobacteria bacterium RIFCSPLOWO2_12_FULL_65_11]
MVAPLVFGSGFCALVFQTAWQREFRLVFGASTAASAAVIAVFMGGLGLGGWLIGPRVDRRGNPLRFYAALEAGVGLTALATPTLLQLTRRVYLSLGGTLALGEAGGTVVRLVLAGFVLLVPTFVAGGTLGAVARAVQSESDRSRRSTALLYGLNTLGAVAGCLAATFWLLERFGTRSTIWLAAVANLLVAAVAATMSLPPADTLEHLSEESEIVEPSTASSERFVLTAAAVVGFAFFLMELVWYRMLGPILGGTVYTFGLVLATALAGVAAGGLLYAVVFRHRSATLTTFAVTCLIESSVIALPYVLGDQVALAANAMRPAPGAVLTGGVRLRANARSIRAIRFQPAASESGGARSRSACARRDGGLGPRGATACRDLCRRRHRATGGTCGAGCRAHPRAGLRAVSVWRTGGGGPDVRRAGNAPRGSSRDGSVRRRPGRHG